MSNIGRMIYGFCSGYFDGDSYGNKRIEAEGYDWIVVRNEHGNPEFASFDNNEDKQHLIDKWSNEE